MTELLLNYGADVHASDEMALCISVTKGNSKMAELLL